MFSMSKLREILLKPAEAKIKSHNQEMQRIKEDTDLANEIANQYTDKAEKANLSNAVNAQQTEADNSPSSKGSVLSRLRVARAIIGTPNSDMGTGGDSLGTFFKKELIQ